MTTRPTPSSMITAVVAGVATTLYYASPDVIASRTARGWTKAGLMAVVAATSVPGYLADRAAARERTTTADDAAQVEEFGSLPSRGKVAVVGVTAAVLALSVGPIVVLERWIFRRGQARAAAGKRLPHTQWALLCGALTAGLSLVPLPPEG